MGVPHVVDCQGGLSWTGRPASILGYEPRTLIDVITDEIEV